MAELGKLLLMFFAGLEIDLGLFHRARNRSIAFGLATTAAPLALGGMVGLVFGYAIVPAIVIGSLLASHTLLGLGIVDRHGVRGIEPVTITVGATVISDTLSLIVFALCLSTFTSGFSVTDLALLLVEIAAYIALLLFGLGRFGATILHQVEDEEDAYFILMLCFMAVAAVLAHVIQLPGIVGAFLAGLALNAAVREKPASDKLEFLANTLFIPIFFIVTGFLIDPLQFVQGLLGNFPLVAGIIGALLLGKGLAAWGIGRGFGYTRDARLTVWALTLPQVAATLAVALVAHATRAPGGALLLDDRMLNVVLVMVLVTSILGPVLTERFARRLGADTRVMQRQSSGPLLTA